MKLSSSVLALTLMAGPSAALQPSPIHTHNQNNAPATQSASLAKRATDFVKTNLVASCLIMTTFAAPAFADEIGVEKEAPTLFTGETVEVRTAY